MGAIARRTAVLVVEDEPILRMMALDMVEDAGFEALEAASADEAMDVLAARPDVRIVFADIEMAGTTDGLGLAALVRDRWPRVEIILVSGRTQPAAAAMPARGTFFRKPYRHGEVVSALRRMS